MLTNKRVVVKNKQQLQSEIDEQFSELEILREIVSMCDIFFSVSLGRKQSNIYNTQTNLDALQNKIVDHIDSYYEEDKYEKEL